MNKLYCKATTYYQNVHIFNESFPIFITMIECDRSSKSQSFSNGVIDEWYVDYDMQQLIWSWNSL